MKPKWNKILAATGAALLGASALAVASDSGFTPEQVTVASRNIRPADAEPCPPDACTIVFKTENGGPPSRVLDPN